jgi:hypothetical protein
MKMVLFIYDPTRNEKLKSDDRESACFDYLSAYIGRTLGLFTAATMCVMDYYDDKNVRLAHRTDPHYLTVYILTHTRKSSINFVSLVRCSSSTSNPVYTRRVDSSTLVFSLSSHRHSYIGLVCNSRFID